MLIFDRKKLRQNRAKAASNLDRYGFLAERAMSGMIDRLADVRRRFENILVVGSIFPLQMRNFSNASRFVTMGGNDPEIMADEEALPFSAHAFDLVIANMTLHGVNDLPGTLIQIRRTLKPDGLFLAAFPGGGTLNELRESLMQAELSVKGGVSPRVMPFVDAREAAGLMQRAGFALPVVDVETLTVTYADSYALMRDLRGMGEGNALAARSRKNPGKSLFAEAEAHYRQNFCDPDGRIRATFNILHLAGWAPHADQQKPLRPGSAKRSLADALGTEEIGAGDMAHHD